MTKKEKKTEYECFEEDIDAIKTVANVEQTVLWPLIEKSVFTAIRNYYKGDTFSCFEQNVQKKISANVEKVISEWSEVFQFNKFFLEIGQSTVERITKMEEYLEILKKDDDAKEKKWRAILGEIKTNPEEKAPKDDDDLLMKS